MVASIRLRYRVLHAVGRFAGRVLEGSLQTTRNTRDSLGKPRRAPYMRLFFAL
jgi:hypothetical protein